MKAQRTVHQSQCSTEISVNAKGQWAGRVKAYSDTMEDARILATEHAAILEETISEKNAPVK